MPIKAGNCDADLEWQSRNEMMKTMMACALSHFSARPCDK